MDGRPVRVGATMSLSDMGGDPETVRAFAQAAEDLGYEHLGVPDHVLGVNVASRPGWGDRNTSEDLFHDPFVLYGFVAACTRTIELSTQVLILPQRQTALVAKQAASLDVLARGRLRLGIGVGWNDVEFVGLNEDFGNRGRRCEEQIEVMRALWAQAHVDVDGRWHTIPDAGINPLPPRREIPIWIGGHVETTLRRTARLASGWMMLVHPPGDEALAAFERLRRYTREAGRDPDDVGIEVWVSAGAGGPEDWREEFRFWRDAGVTHVTVNNAYARHAHARIPGRSLDDHLAALEAYRDAVADLR